MLSEDLPARILSEVSDICFEYTAQFEGTFYERFYSKEIASLSLTVVLRFFLLLCLLCQGLVKMFSISSTRSFVKLMLSKLLVPILRFFFFFLTIVTPKLNLGNPLKQLRFRYIENLYFFEISFTSFIPFHITVGARSNQQQECFYFFRVSLK